MGIFGALAIADALLILCLPETRDKDVPDTIKQAEEFDRCVCVRHKVWSNLIFVHVFCSEQTSDEQLSNDIALNINSTNVAN